MCTEPTLSTPDSTVPQDAPPHASGRRDALYLVILLAVGAAVFFGTMGCRDLWEPEELRYAQVTSEMMQSHQWFVLHLNTVTYPDKPPLFFWAISLCSRALGHADKPTEFSMRLPSVLSGLGCLVFTFLLGRRLYGGRAGLLAGLFLLTMPFFAQMAIEARMDMMLTLFITASLFCFYVAYVDKYGTWLYLVAYVLTGLAILTKGPVGALLPIIAFALFALLKDNLHGAIYWHLKGRVLIAGAAQKLRIRLSPVPMKIGWGLLVMLAIVAPWLVPACIQGGSNHAYELLFHQNFNRYFDSWTHQNEPFYLYLLFVPLQVLPWALFLPSMIAFSAAREPRETQRSAATAAPGCWARRFPLIWFVTIFLFFTFCSSKRWIYTLPLVPAAALMMGGLVEDFFAAQAKWTVSRIVAVIAFLATLALMLVGAIVALAAIALNYHEYLRIVVAGSVCLLLGIAAVVWFYFKKRHVHCLILIILSILLAWTATYWIIFDVGALAALALKYYEWLSIGGPASVILLLGIVPVVWLCLKKRNGYVLGLTLLTILLAWTAMCWTLFPYRNREISAKRMFARIAPFVRPSETLYTYGTERNGYNYYWNREPGLVNLTKNILTEWNAAKKEKRVAEGQEQFLTLFRGPNPVICLMSQRAFDKLKADPNFKPHLLISNLMGSRNLVLVSNQPREPIKNK